MNQTADLNLCDIKSGVNKVLPFLEFSTNRDGNGNDNDDDDDGVVVSYKHSLSPAYAIRGKPKTFM